MNRDVGMTRTLRDISPEWSDTLYILITLPGDWLILVPLLALLYLWDVGSTLRRPNADGPLCTDRTVFVIATVFGGLALVYLLKVVIGAPRPPEELHVVSTETDAVPSGHAMAATVFWGALALWLPVATRRLRFVVAVLVVGMVGFSRLGLGVHFLGDVVAGVGFGVVYLAIVALVVDERPERALAVAFAIAAASVVMTGGQGRALLAFGGIVGLAVGWRVVESRPARRVLQKTVVPALQR